MSALPPKPDMFIVEIDVCFVPLADITLHAGTKVTPKRLFAIVPGQTNTK
jgi:hypothetical protein